MQPFLVADVIVIDLLETQSEKLTGYFQDVIFLYFLSKTNEIFASKRIFY